MNYRPGIAVRIELSTRHLFRWMMRKGPALLLLYLLVVMALATPVVSGEGVNFLEVKEGYEKTVEAPDSTFFTWVVYNNDTVPYLIEAEVGFLPGSDEEGRDEIGIVVDQNYSALYPGESRVVTVEITTSQTSQTRDFHLLVYLTTTKMNDPGQVDMVIKTATVHVEALFESAGNKIFNIWDNNLPSPFNTLTWSFVITIVLWLVIASFIYYVVDPLAGHFTKKTKTELDDRIREIVRLPMFAIIVMFGLVDSLSIINISQESHIWIVLLYQVFLVVILAIVAYQIFDRVVIYYAERWSRQTETEIDDVLVPLFHKLGIIVIPIIALGAILSIFGMDLTLLVASMGVIGLVVAFAVQETLGNLFAGMQLLLDRPFKIGDIIELDSGEICEVKKIGLRSTTVYNTADHEIIVVPNNDMVNKKVINYSRPDMRRSMNAEIGVAYGSDLEKVKRILLNIAIQHPDVIKEDGKMPYVRLARFGDSSVDFKLWYWVEVKKMWRVASEVRQAIYDSFMAEGIEIPFPQNVVTLKQEKPKT